MLARLMCARVASLAITVNGMRLIVPPTADALTLAFSLRHVSYMTHMQLWKIGESSDGSEK